MTLSPEQIWENWKSNSGPCKGCPHHDDDLHFRPTLTARQSAKVMIVGEDPNRSSDRTAKNSKEIPELELKQRGDLGQNDNLENVLHNSWPISRFVKGVINNCGLDISEVYLTNQKKCSNIGNGSDKEDEKRARRQCEPYLRDEIEFIDPSMVILSGKKVIQFVNTEFGLSLSTKPAKNAGTFAEHGKQIYVVAPNFGRFEGNLAQHSDFSSTEEFFTSIKNLI